MPIYTFYPCRPDGSSPSFKAVDLGSDKAAAETAEALLREHQSAAYMSVFLGERQVLVLERSRAAV